MKAFCAMLVMLFVLTPAAFAKGKSGKSVNMSCDDAIKQAGVLATNRNWQITDPTPWKGAAN